MAQKWGQNMILSSIPLLFLKLSSLSLPNYYNYYLAKSLPNECFSKLTHKPKLSVPVVHPQICVFPYRKSLCGSRFFRTKVKL